MDPSEQPTVWPPTPTLPPPEAEQPTRFNLRLPLPEWLAYVLKESVPPCAILIGVITGLKVYDHLPLPSWRWYTIVVATTLAYNSIAYWVRTRKRRNKPEL